eukprot:scaffold6649_cov124-Isochrysis_galbana.AAC.3
MNLLPTEHPGYQEAPPRATCASANRDCSLPPHSHRHGHPHGPAPSLAAVHLVVLAALNCLWACAQQMPVPPRNRCALANRCLHLRTVCSTKLYESQRGPWPQAA